MDIYLIPGLGTDRRLFSRMDLDGLPVRHLEWPPFQRGCTLEGIARELALQVDATRPHALIGVSMGGMVAQEMAVLTRPARVVLISTWKGPHEWPKRVRLAAWLGLYRTITDLTMRATWPLKRRLLAQRDPELDRLLFDMACSQTARKIRTGTAAILRWRGSAWTGPVVRVHGDADRLVPLRFPVDHLVRGGGHTMVLNRAEEVARAVRRAIDE